MSATLDDDILKLDPGNPLEILHEQAHNNGDGILSHPEQSREVSAKKARKVLKARRADTRSVVASEGCVPHGEDSLDEMEEGEEGEEDGLLYHGVQHEKTSLTLSSQVTKTRKPWARRAKMTKEGQDGNEAADKAGISVTDEEESVMGDGGEDEAGIRVTDEEESVMGEGGEDEEVDVNGNLSLEEETHSSDGTTGHSETQMTAGPVYTSVPDRAPDDGTYQGQGQGHVPCAAFAENPVHVEHLGSVQLRCHVPGLRPHYQHGGWALLCV